MTARVFVFGSNLAGRHGKGAALYALRHHGAIYGRATGLQGNSYAIPTKDERLQTLPLDIIADHVASFLSFARRYPELSFQLTAIGCGLAGYHPSDIAPMFRDAPSNVELPQAFIDALGPLGHRATFKRTKPSCEHLECVAECDHSTAHCARLVEAHYDWTKQKGQPLGRPSRPDK